MSFYFVRQTPFSLTVLKMPIKCQIQRSLLLHVTNLLDGLGLIDLLVEGLASNEVWDVVIVLLLGALLLLHALVALSQLAKGGKGIWAELVEDTWDELGELLVLTGTVDGEGVGWNGGVDCTMLELAVRTFAILLSEPPY